MLYNKTFGGIAKRNITLSRHFSGTRFHKPTDHKLTVTGTMQELKIHNRAKAL